MNPAQLNQAICGALTGLKDHAGELRDLDQALGDGDLGITVTAGADAVSAALGALDASATPTEIVKATAKAFANANPSTFAALVAGGLLAGARTFEGKTDISVADAATFVHAAADSVAARGKAQLGDKTILDALVPVADALAANTDDARAALASAITAADQAVVATTNLQSQRGRAAWLQERSVGLPDPGETAILRFLQAWQAAN